MNRTEALTLLRTATNNAHVDFRDGQWEAITALVNQKQRALVVQSTGWGKSMVYFIATRILRDQGSGPTLIVSPLLALMRNQVAAAHRLNIKAATINSSNSSDWEKIQDQILSHEIDALLISPERLANEDFLTTTLLPIAAQIGLLVIDEAHCISDWGHDFRPDYRRIARILNALPPNLPVLATTATANDRVFNDVAAQLGSSLITQRGSLTRTSLILDAAHLPNRAERMAWLADHLPHLPGSGIIYTLTVRDAERLANWLQSEGIPAAAYSGQLDNTIRQDLEDQLLNNQLKVLVATTALGMGFDKPDLGFVIHYQCPSSVIHYYQQVGRAGRAIDTAYGLLMSGSEDEDITDFFIESAFPTPSDVDTLLTALESSDGMSLPSLESSLNLSYGQIEKTLKILALESPAPVVKQGSKWYRTANAYTYDHAKVQQITALRRAEQQQMRDYLKKQDCLMQFLATALDDANPQPCGRCSVCTNNSPLSRPIAPDTLKRALAFLQRTQIPIEPRKKWPSGGLPVYGFRGNISANLRAEPGIALCLWGDPGWGEHIKLGKYTTGSFSDELVTALAAAIRNWQPDPSPTWITCVPSRNRPDLVPNFTARLAQALNLPYIPCITKIKQNQPQKTMQNSWQQATNLDGCFEITSPLHQGSVLLVDDMVDSRWTMTVIAALLRRGGSGPVFPVALALNTTKDS